VTAFGFCFRLGMAAVDSAVEAAAATAGEAGEATGVDGTACSMPTKVLVAAGQTVAYRTFVETRADASSIPGAGTGLVTVHSMPRFTWLGLYPGKAAPARHSPPRHPPHCEPSSLESDGIL